MGRQPGQTVVLSEAYVSRQHASILFTGSGFEVRDLGSTHGTFLNGNRIERASLNPGDALQLGSPQGPRLVFDLQTRGSAAATPSQALPDLLTSLTAMRDPSLAGTAAAAQGMEQLNFLLSAARN